MDMTEALKGVDKQILAKLKQNVTQSQSSLSDMKSQKQRMSKSIDRQLAPLLEHRTASEAALTAASAGVGLLSPEVIFMSSDLAALNPSIDRALSSQVELNDNLIFDIEHLQAEQKMLSADIAQLDATNDYFTRVLQSIDEALATPD